MVRDGRIPPNVTHLNLHRNNLTDLTPLAGLTDLVWLDLERNGNGTGKHKTRTHGLVDISPLAGLVNLQRLDLDYNGDLTDISPLAGMVNMVELDLNHTDVSDISVLANMTVLEQLDLKHTPVSDLTPLTELTSLWELELQHTNVNDLSALAGMTSLLDLYLQDTLTSFITQVMPLQESLPNTTIHHNGRLQQNVTPPPPCECRDCESCRFVEIPIPPCDCRNCGDCGFLGGRFGFGRVTNNTHTDRPTVADALAILRYLIGLPSVIDDCDDARAAANITTPGLGDPVVNDALQVLRSLVGLNSLLDPV
jgi:Leucine-rich repeat (LRR) protein